MNANDAPAKSGDGLKTLLLVGAGIVLLLLILAALLLPQMCSARETARGNTCRSNMRACASALFQYQNDHGNYPGYTNVLQRNDDTPFVDPETGEITPVSWCVMILPYVDRRVTFDQWRKSPGDNQFVARPDGPAVAEPFQIPSKPKYLIDQYLDVFLCPSDPQQSKTGTPISFVANTGLPDRPTAIVAEDGTGTPRDWAANGMLFDNFSEHELVKPNGPRGPMEFMSESRVKDLTSMTILLTENIDATDYVFRSKTHAADHWKACEVTTGATWQPGPIDASRRLPTMTPPTRALAVNAERGKGDGASYDYCRPSSNHPQSVNVAYVGQNVMQLRDTISYYVYAKLMASDDEHVMEADHPFRTHELTDADIGP